MDCFALVIVICLKQRAVHVAVPPIYMVGLIHMVLEIIVKLVATNGKLAVPG